MELEFLHNSVCDSVCFITTEQHGICEPHRGYHIWTGCQAPRGLSLKNLADIFYITVSVHCFCKLL